MADFQEVMNKWHEICRKQDACVTCPVRDKCDRIPPGTSEKSAEFEKMILEISDADNREYQRGFTDGANKGYTDGYNSGIEDGWKIGNQEKWIPVTLKLPEDDLPEGSDVDQIRCYVTARVWDGGVIVAHTMEDLRYKEGGEWNWYSCICVTAWMLEPKPYKEEEE